MFVIIHWSLVAAMLEAVLKCPLKAGKAKWKAFYDKFPWLKGQPFYLRRSCFWDEGERNLKSIKIKLKKI